ncbi:MAG: hypothetical protein H0T89_12255 [Deltaproteobacteria bacterium]|nr:hypothetical protein [Deltaproteobacteria bacterium]MDQ3300846.1 hypothetical protein [Myxococcota bacterium]
MWARVHKVDRVRPKPDGGAIVLVEDERNAAAMARVPGLSTVIAVARVLNARRVLEAKFGGKGEIRYATAASLPAFLQDAVTRAGANVSDASGERIVIPSSPAAISSVIDNGFVELAHHVRKNVGAPTVVAALAIVEAERRKATIDREAQPAAYWTAVLELAALAGELSRSRGGRWVETADMPVPFAIRFATGELAMPAKLAQRIVDGTADETSLAATT